MEIISGCCEKPCDDKRPDCICGCLGYGYVPVQAELGRLYDNDTALRCGTIFPVLDLDITEYGKICKKWGGGDDE